MGRRSTFSDDDVFAAVGRMLVRDGEVRMQSVVAETGVSVGSLYHRFGSREGLLARAWLDTLAAFHDRFLAALDQPGDVPITYADVTRAEQALGYRPETPLAEGVKKFCRWYLAEKAAGRVQ